VDNTVEKWRAPVLMIVVQLIAIAVQWGIFSAKMDEHSRRLQNIEDTLRLRDVESGQAKEFHDDTVRRLEQIDRELKDQRRH
jgi:hypothetical protein